MKNLFSVLIQAITAAITDRDLVYYTFHDEDTTNELNALLELIKSNNLNVSHIYQLLLDYSNYFHDALAEMKKARANRMRKNRSESNDSEASNASAASSPKDSDISSPNKSNEENATKSQFEILSILDFFRSKF